MKRSWPFESGAWNVLIEYEVFPISGFRMPCSHLMVLLLQSCQVWEMGTGMKKWISGWGSLGTCCVWFLSHSLLPVTYAWTTVTFCPRTWGQTILNWPQFFPHYSHFHQVLIKERWKLPRPLASWCSRKWWLWFNLQIYSYQDCFLYQLCCILSKRQIRSPWRDGTQQGSVFRLCL